MGHHHQGQSASLLDRRCVDALFFSILLVVGLEYYSYSNKKSTGTAPSRSRHPAAVGGSISSASVTHPGSICDDTMISPDLNNPLFLKFCFWILWIGVVAQVRSWCCAEWHTAVVVRSAVHMLCPQTIFFPVYMFSKTTWEWADFLTHLVLYQK